VTHAIECKYSRNGISETVALFKHEMHAHEYANRHNSEGSCILYVVQSDLEQLGYTIRVVHGNPKFTSTSYPTGISFRHECEARAFAYRYVHCTGGYSIVVQQ
jgi:hypothetical protein